MTLRERFEAKVMPEPMSGCWLWTGALSNRGYGRLNNRAAGDLAHRTAWQLFRGAIPAGLDVCHHCDLPACVNPDHLWLGTARDNAKDMARKGRQALQRYPELIRRGDQHPSRRHPERVPRGDRSGARLHPERMPRGERHGQAKLTAEQVLEIRARLAAGATQTAIARGLGLSQTTISLIAKRKNWAWLP